MDKDTVTSIAALEAILGTFLQQQAIAQSATGTKAVWWLHELRDDTISNLEQSEVSLPEEADEIRSLAIRKVSILVGNVINGLPQSHHDAANAYLTATKVDPDKQT